MGSTVAPSPIATPLSQQFPSYGSSINSQSTMNYPDYTDADVAKAPWKYSGYRVFSKWVASDQSFFMVRRFGALQARVVLSLQDEIVQLEDELDSMDKAYSRKAVPDVVDNGSFRNDPWRKRRKLVKDTLPRKLKQYNNYINEYCQLMSRPSVRPEDLTNVRNWLGFGLKDPGKHPINEDEMDFIGHTKDLIAVLPKQISWFRKVLERTFVLRIPGVKKHFERKEKDIEYYDEIRAIEDGSLGTIRKTIWQNDKRVDRLSSGFMAVVGLGMLIAPLWVLEKINQNEPSTKLGVISVFIVVFFLLLAIATTARVFDALAATAAYSAVLMIFLQLGGSGQPAS